MFVLWMKDIRGKGRQEGRKYRVDLEVTIGGNGRG